MPGHKIYGVIFDHNSTVLEVHRLDGFRGVRLDYGQVVVPISFQGDGEVSVHVSEIEGPLHHIRLKDPRDGDYQLTEAQVKAQEAIIYPSGFAEPVLGIAASEANEYTPMAIVRSEKPLEIGASFREQLR